MTPVSLTVWYSDEAASISWNWCGWTRVSMIATRWTIGMTMWRPGSSVPGWTEPKLVTTPTLPGRHLHERRGEAGDEDEDRR